MKQIRSTGWIILLALFAFGCQRETKALPEINSSGQTGSKPVAPTTCNSNAYTITLESRTLVAGNWEWVWSVFNPNPGNGLNGTVQDMSHWGMQFSTCFNWEHVAGAAYSFDGITWTTFTPAYVTDPSQACVTTPVLKFAAGTSGGAKTYYKLVLTMNYDPVNTAFGYYKSGSRMPCCTFNFTGVGCLHVGEGCSYSQGYWFSNGDHAWPDVNGAAPGNVTIGGYDYTEAEGRDIWNTSNAGGMKDSKKAFLQVAAIKLSGNSISPGASVWSDVNICETWLATLGKLSPGNLPTGNSAVSTAAGNIGEWITNNHCE